MRERSRGVIYALLTIGLIVAVVEAATRLSQLISEGALSGLILAVKGVIPTSLPFMIISDIFIAYARPEYIPALPRIFKWIFCHNTRFETSPRVINIDGAYLNFKMFISEA